MPEFVVALLKLFLTRTERGLCAAFAFAVLFCAFVLYLSGRDGWRLGLIGIICLSILKMPAVLKTLLSPFRREPPRADEPPIKPAANIQPLATGAKSLLRDYLTDKYDLPPALVAAMRENETAQVKETLGYYVPPAFVALLTLLDAAEDFDKG